MAGKAHAWHRKPAGKHPALRPKPTTSASASKISKPKPALDSKQTRTATPKAAVTPWQNATRRILTRSQSKIFRLLDLPPELRNLVYHHATAPSSEDGAVDLTNLTLPLGLSPSRQVRKEVLPVFFSANHFKVQVTSNYCVFRKHFHHSEHVRYYDAGKIDLSPLLVRGVMDNLIQSGRLDASDRDEATRTALADDIIRFKHVTFEVKCVCCTPGKAIAKLELNMQGMKAVVECTMAFNPARNDTRTRPSMELIFAHVEAVVMRIGDREEFNGFTVADLVRVAGFTCYETLEQAMAREGLEI